MTAKVLLAAALALVFIVGSIGIAWLSLPSLAPDIVLAHVRFADPVARALIAKHGDSFAGFAASSGPSVAIPQIDPWRWSLDMHRMRGDPEAALVSAIDGRRPGCVFLAVALLAEYRDARCSGAARKGQRWSGHFTSASDAALLSAAEPGRPPGTRVLAQRVLAGQGVDAALPLIVVGLEDADPLVRARTAYLLGHWGDAWELHAWDRSGRGIRSEPRPGVFGARRACPALVRRLASETDRFVRFQLVAALAFIRDETTDTAIIAAIARDGVVAHSHRWLMTWSSPRIRARLATLPPPPPSRWP